MPKFKVTKTRTWTQVVEAKDEEDASYLADREYPYRFQEFDDPEYEVEALDSEDEVEELGWAWFTRGCGRRVPQVCDDWEHSANQYQSDGGWTDGDLDEYLCAQLPLDKAKLYSQMLDFFEPGNKLIPRSDEFNAKYYSVLESLLRGVKLPDNPPKETT